jgi:hypothetical protein
MTQTPRQQADAYRQLVASQRARIRLATSVSAAAVILVGLAILRNWHYLALVFGLLLFVSSLIELQTARWRARDYANRQAAADARVHRERYSRVL